MYLTAGDVQPGDRTGGMPFVVPNSEAVMQLLSIPDFQPQGSAPASLEQINALRTSLVGQEQLDSSCNICLEAFQLNEEIKHLPCKPLLPQRMFEHLAHQGRPVSLLQIFL